MISGGVGSAGFDYDSGTFGSQTFTIGNKKGFEQWRLRY